MTTKKYKAISPDDKLVVINNLTKFCKENRLSVSSMRRVINGNQVDHNGWGCAIKGKRRKKAPVDVKQTEADRLFNLFMRA